VGCREVVTNDAASRKVSYKDMTPPAVATKTSEA
jgi:hypothetical protein